MAWALELIVILLIKTENEEEKQRNNNKIEIEARLCGIGKGKIEKKNSNRRFFLSDSFLYLLQVKYHFVQEAFSKSSL